MTPGQIFRCRGEGFIPVESLVFANESSGYKRFRCPWCATQDHYATINVTEPGLDARPIHCWETGKMGWVNMLDYAAQIQGTIRVTLATEEARFRAILDRYESAPISAQDAVARWHSEGVPLELFEDDVNDVKLMHQLATEHRATGKMGDRGVGAYGGIR